MYLLGLGLHSYCDVLAIDPKSIEHSGKTKNQDKPFLLMSCVPQAFCHSSIILTHTMYVTSCTEWLEHKGRTGRTLIVKDESGQLDKDKIKTGNICLGAFLIFPAPRILHSCSGNKRKFPEGLLQMSFQTDLAYSWHLKFCLPLTGVFSMMRCIQRGELPYFLLQVKLDRCCLATVEIFIGLFS